MASKPSWPWGKPQRTDPPGQSPDLAPDEQDQARREPETGARRRMIVSAIDWAFEVVKYWA
jgi:hypothetical protein